MLPFCSSPRDSIPSASASVIFVNFRWVGFPQSVYTPSASVRIRRTSAPRSRARMAETRSLSTTASIPSSTPFASR